MAAKGQTAGAVVPYIAQKAVRPITEALTADLAVIRTQTRPRGKRAQPIDLELHVNPAALGVAAVGAGLTLWLMQLRVDRTPVSVVHSIWFDKTYTLEDWNAYPNWERDLPAGYHWVCPPPTLDHIVDETLSGLPGQLLRPANVFWSPALWFAKIVQKSTYKVPTPDVTVKNVVDQDLMKITGVRVSGHAYWVEDTVRSGLSQRQGFSIPGSLL